MTSFITKISRYSATDLCRKTIFWMRLNLGSIAHYCRKARFYFYTKNWLTYIGKNVTITTMGNNIKIGCDTIIYNNAIVELTENARLRIGNNFTDRKSVV